jgi:hypothetical protein
MRNQTNSTSRSGAFSAAQAAELQIEAARYAVLRRLTPSLRHHMVRPLQPIGLIYGVMQHKLDAPAPDLDSVREDADKINEFAKAALDECNDISTWLAPEPGVAIRVDQGVRECVSLLATMLHFCGFRLENQVDELAAPVHHNAMRMVLIAALLEMTDSLAEPALLVISAAVDGDEVVITLKLGQAQEGRANRYENGYRKLVWSDVQALAGAENVGLARQERRVVMRFPMATDHSSLALSAMVH